MKRILALFSGLVMACLMIDAYIVSLSTIYFDVSDDVEVAEVSVSAIVSILVNLKMEFSLGATLGLMFYYVLQIDLPAGNENVKLKWI